jgi:hypothetical protein
VRPRARANDNKRRRHGFPRSRKGLEGRGRVEGRGGVERGRRERLNPSLLSGQDCSRESRWMMMCAEGHSRAVTETPPCHLPWDQQLLLCALSAQGSCPPPRLALNLDAASASIEWLALLITSGHPSSIQYDTAQHAGARRSEVAVAGMWTGRDRDKDIAIPCRHRHKQGQPLPCTDGFSGRVTR